MASSPYEYVPLIPDQPQLRLITLHPGQFSGDIVLSLEHHEFSENHKPIYEALSYVWGSPENRETVWIQDMNMRGTLLATQNLCCALRHLRLQDATRVLWIDAISIDQANLQERSREVGRMGDIYSSAEQVLVWLGPRSSDSDTAIQMIESLSMGIKIVSPYEIDIVHGSQADLFLQSGEIRNTGPWDFTALKNFFQRPWFGRLWIRQEVALARRTLAVLGHCRISWENLEKTIRLVRESFSYSQAQTVTELERVDSLFISRQMSITYLLRISSNTAYSDPRDIVYANLSMSSYIEGLHIHPDYEKSKAAVYKDLFFKYLQKYGRVDLLRLCDLRNLSPGLPSFVPDFYIPQSRTNLIIGNADGGSTQTKGHSEGDILKVSGLSVTTVNNIKGRSPAVYNAVETIRTCQEWEPDHLLTATYFSDESLLDAYSSTLTGSKGSERYMTSSAAKEVRTAFLTAVWSGRDFGASSSKDEDVEEYLHNLAYEISGRVFFETTDGYIGVSPGDVKTGDRICVLLGSNAPFILRPRADNSTCYQVVGPCYLHGVMFGEVILGPIPGGWICYPDDNSLRWSFRNEETGELSLEDPRLWPLAWEWAIHYCDEDYIGSCSGNCKDKDQNGLLIRPCFFNSITKEYTEVDPRLTPDGLKEHGVALEEFTLV